MHLSIERSLVRAARRRCDGAPPSSLTFQRYSSHAATETDGACVHACSRCVGATLLNISCGLFEFSERGLHFQGPSAPGRVTSPKSRHQSFSSSHSSSGPPETETNSCSTVLIENNEVVLDRWHSMQLLAVELHGSPHLAANLCTYARYSVLACATNTHPPQAHTHAHRHAPTVSRARKAQCRTLAASECLRERAPWVVSTATSRTGTGLTPPTSAPSDQPFHICTGTGAHPCHICTGTWRSAQVRTAGRHACAVHGARD
jgi:hypothetical protein